MSCNYADGLSPYHDKGQLGLEEKFDSKSVVVTKVSLLTKWINEAKHVVIHTGAGISTSAGIPDFRGPRGVWTLQEKGEKPDLSKDFNEAIPTITHMAIMKLVEKQKVKYVVSQNIDGLHLRSNLQRKFLSELHGNMFTEQCNSCNRQFVRNMPVPTVGQKMLNKPCPATKANGRPCRGRLHDTILDWEHNLPENDLCMADYHSCMADLSICLGTTMQIVPSGNLPLYTKRHGGKLVIVNLQPTKHDKKGNLLIHTYVDDVMTMLMKNLGIKIPKYSPKNDPTRSLSTLSENFLEWTISDSVVKKMKKVYEEKCGSKEAKKRLEMIYDDVPLSSLTSKNFKRKIKEDEDSDLEVLDVIVKPKRGRESSRRGSRKSQAQTYQQTITIKKVVTPPPKKAKYEGEKITIKKNVTPTKTKYEIITKPKKTPKCEIVYGTDGDGCNDLDMICESDDDEMTNNFTYNFKMYLHTDEKKEVKRESVDQPQEVVNKEIKDDIKEEHGETVKEVEQVMVDKMNIEETENVSDNMNTKLEVCESNTDIKVEVKQGIETERVEVIDIYRESSEKGISEVEEILPNVMLNNVSSTENNIRENNILQPKLSPAIAADKEDIKPFALSDMKEDDDKLNIVGTPEIKNGQKFGSGGGLGENREKDAVESQKTDEVFGLQENTGAGEVIGSQQMEKTNESCEIEVELKKMKDTEERMGETAVSQVIVGVEVVGPPELKEAADKVEVIVTPQKSEEKVENANELQGVKDVEEKVTEILETRQKEKEIEEVVGLEEKKLVQEESEEVVGSREVENLVPLLEIESKTTVPEEINEVEKETRTVANESEYKEIGRENTVTGECQIKLDEKSNDNVGDIEMKETRTNTEVKDVVTKDTMEMQSLTGDFINSPTPDGQAEIKAEPEIELEPQNLEKNVEASVSSKIKETGNNSQSENAIEEAEKNSSESKVQ